MCKHPIIKNNLLFHSHGNPKKPELPFKSKAELFQVQLEKKTIFTHIFNLVNENHVGCGNKWPQQEIASMMENQNKILLTFSSFWLCSLKVQ